MPATRTVTGKYLQSDGSAWASQTGTITLLSEHAVWGESLLKKEIAAASDGSGDVSVAIPVPDSGAWAWIWQLPDGQTFRFTLDSGSATTIHALQAAESTTATADEITNLIAGKADKVVPAADVNIAVLDGTTGNVEDGGQTIAELIASAGSKTYTAYEPLSTYDSGSPPAAPVTTVVGIAAGDTVLERYNNAELKWSYDGSYTLEWVTEDQVPSTAVAVAAGAFATATEPTDAEAETWIAANVTSRIVGQIYTYRGTAANPDFVWMDNGDVSIERIKTAIHEDTVTFKADGTTGDIVTIQDNSGNDIGNLSYENILEIGKAGVSTGKIKATHSSDGTVEFGGNTVSFSRPSVNYLRTTATGSSLILQTENTNLIYLRNNQDMTFYATGDYKMIQIDFSAKRVGMGADPSGAALDIRAANSDNIQQWRNNAGTIQATMNSSGSLGLFGVTPPSQAAYDAAPSATVIRDILINFGLMAAS